MDEKGLTCERVVINTIPGKEAKDDSFVSQGCGAGASVW